MRPKISSKRKIEYSAPGNISLFSYLQSGISKKEFYVVFAQFIECVKKIERYGFNINNLVMDTKYTFYNQMTREVQFLYQPIMNGNAQNNIFSYAYEIMQSTVPNLDESTAFLNDLMAHVKGLQSFSTASFENYLIKVYPQVYKTVKRMKPGDSTSLNATGRTYFEKKYDTDVVDGDTDVFDEEEATGLLNENDADVLLDDEEGTALLGEDDGTTILENNKKSYPYLIRVNRYEKVDVNKPVFRIGKEKSYVDYFVMNNNAVSRIHADISTKNNSYFIKDNNSTNHTFVNGTMIPVNQNVQIFDGDSIMLANEPFEFHIY